MTYTHTSTHLWSESDGFVPHKFPIRIFAGTGKVWFFFHLKTTKNVQYFLQEVDCSLLLVQSDKRHTGPTAIFISIS